MDVFGSYGDLYYPKVQWDLKRNWRLLSLCWNIPLLSIAGKLTCVRVGFKKRERRKIVYIHKSRVVGLYTWVIMFNTSNYRPGTLMWLSHERSRSLVHGVIASEKNRCIVPAQTHLHHPAKTCDPKRQLSWALLSRTPYEPGMPHIAKLSLCRNQKHILVSCEIQLSFCPFGYGRTYNGSYVSHFVMALLPSHDFPSFDMVCTCCRHCDMTL